MRLVALVAFLLACSETPNAVAPAGRAVPPPAGDLVAGPPANDPAQGRYIFRHWTFGDEPFWTDTLHLNEVIETGVSPATALAVGLKVDAAQLPPGFLAGADLTSPATTVELLRRDAVVGVEAQVTADRHIKRLGITCALCHSTVDNSVAPGKVRRGIQPGWHQQSRRDPPRPRLARRRARDLYGGRTGQLLERLRGRHPDARARLVFGPRARDRHPTVPGPGDAGAPGAACVSAEPERLFAGNRQLRSGSGRAREAGLHVDGPVRELPPAGDGLHGRESRRLARSVRNGHGSGARESPQEPSVPDHTAPGPVAAPTVFP